MVLDKYNFKELFNENLDDFFKYELFIAGKNPWPENIILY